MANKKPSHCNAGFDQVLICLKIRTTSQDSDNARFDEKGYKFVVKGGGGLAFGSKD